MSVRVARGLVDVVEGVGVPRARLLRAADMRPELLEQPEFRFPYSELERLCEAALLVTGDPALGLHCAERLSAETFNPILHMLAQSATLRQGFESLAQFRPLLADHASFEILETDDLVAVRCSHTPSESVKVRRFGTEVLMVSLFRLIRSFSASALLPRVNFDYRAPSYRDEYARVFKGAARFEQPFNEVVFDRALMSAVSPNNDDDVHRALRLIAEQRLLQLTERVPYAIRVRDFLVKHTPAGRIEMSTVARSLGLSVRSLRRRMSAEGMTFYSVANDAQSIIAKNLLRYTKRTIQEVAFELGFESTSSFHRAFKRWTGTTPQAYRDTAR